MTFLSNIFKYLVVNSSEPVFETGAGAEVVRIAEAGAEVEVETGETEAEIGGLRRALAVPLAGEGYWCPLD